MNIDAIRYFMFVAMLANGITVLWLQWSAYTKHRHPSFLLLASSTIIGLTSILALALPTAMPSVKPWYALWYTQITLFSAVVYVCYSALAIWGISSLFRSYGELRQSA